MDFTEGVLAGDGKNYHSWAHRQWVVFHYKLQDNDEQRKKELDYVLQMLTKDIRSGIKKTERKGENLLTIVLF